jgi:hypothetical protein
MTSERRINKLERSLAAKEKFSLWLRRAKAAGGLVPHWEKELSGPLAPFDWFDDEEAYFLFRLVNDVNFSILNSASTNQNLRAFAHCALDGIVRQIGRTSKSGVLVPVRPILQIAARARKLLCTKFKSLLGETETMASAIEEISKTNLGGEDILFSDMRAIFDAELSNLRATADLFDPLTDWLDIEPLRLKKLAPGSPIVRAKVDSIVHLSRAEALVGCSDLRKFKDALQRAFPEFNGLSAPFAMRSGD